MNNGGWPHDRALYILSVVMAGVAGSIVSLSLRAWQEMTWLQVMMAVFVGATFAWFAVPYLVVDVFHINSFLTSIRVASFMTFAGAAFGFLALPLMWDQIKKRLGLEESKEQKS